MQDLASKVSDDRFNTLVNTANIFMKKLPEGEVITRHIGSVLTLANYEINTLREELERNYKKHC